MAQSLNPNPFLMPHIIETILDSHCLKTADHLTLRAVSSDWNLAATKRCKLTLNLKTQEDISKMKEAIVLFQNPDVNLPALETIKLNMKLLVPTESTDTRELQTLLGKFLSFVSDQVLNLSLKQTSQLCNMPEFEEDCYPALTFTKLKSLNLLSINPEENAQSLLMRLCQKVLLSSPVLREVDIERNLTFVPSEVVEKGLGHLVLQHIPPTVEKLAVIGALGRHDIQTLGHVQLPNLRHMTMEVNCYNQAEIIATDIYNIFNNKKDALEDLHFYLTRDTENSTLEYRMPIFPALTSLYLSLDAMQSVQYPNAPAFPLSFPKVSKLEFSYSPSQEVLRTLFPLGFIVPEVTCLTWSALSFFKLKHSQILHLAQAFVNLKYLVLQTLNPNQASGLTCIFHACRQLEYLSMTICAHDDAAGVELDSIFTGIPIDILNVLRIVLFSEWQNLKLEQLKLRPGISDLKCLSVLEIASAGCSQNTIKITDFTAHYGFLQIPTLDNLTTPKFQMSNNYISILQKKLGEQFSRAEDMVFSHSKSDTDSDFDSDSESNEVEGEGDSDGEEGEHSESDDAEVQEAVSESEEDLDSNPPI